MWIDGVCVYGWLGECVGMNVGGWWRVFAYVWVVVGGCEWWLVGCR